MTTSLRPSDVPLSQFPGRSDYGAGLSSPLVLVSSLVLPLTTCTVAGSYLSSPPLSFLIYKVDSMLISTSHAFCENLRLLACGKLWLVVGAWSAQRVTCCCCCCCDLWLLLWVNLLQSQSPACGPLIISHYTAELSPRH